MTFEILQEKQLFYTKGLKSKYGFELELVLDTLTTQRVGMQAARDKFEWFLSNLMIGAFEVAEKSNGVLYTVNSKNRQSIEEEIYSLSSNAVYVKKSSKRKSVAYQRLIFSDARGHWPWNKNCSLECRVQMLGLFTLYDALHLLNDFYTPNSKNFFNYVVWSSDDNTFFLRTCYRKKQSKISNGTFAASLTHLVVAFEEPFKKENLCFVDNKGFLLSKTHLQICFTRSEGVLEEIEWCIEMGYKYCQVFDLLKGAEVTDDFISSVPENQ